MSATPIIIAIDGHSSCGKSTLAKALAKKLGYTYIDSGAMYRAVALYFLRHDVPFKVEQRDIHAIQEALSQIHIAFKYNESLGKQETYLNDENVEGEIRQMFVADHVSKVSTISEVRRFLVAQQQAKGTAKGIVMDGRDIGTVVFPEAELKIFMTAEPTIRAQRRLEEMQEKGQDFTLEEVLNNLQKRDHIDSTRADSPLKKAEDALVLDNTHLSPSEQFEKALAWAHSKISLNGTS